MAKRRAGSGKGKVCTYCRRTLEASTSHSKLAATRDHVIPKSKWKVADRLPFGVVTVWACRQCNLLKGDKMPSEWEAFMVANPEWWRQPAFQCGTLNRIPTPSMTARETATWLAARAADTTTDPG